MTDGQQLIDALTADSWQVIGRGAAHVRLKYRSEPESIVVPLDPEAPEYADQISIALIVLGLAADRGASAKRVLDELRASGVST